MVEHTPEERGVTSSNLVLGTRIVYYYSMMYFKKNKRGGFTLIELLVVISIIGLLSSIVLSSINEARNKAKYTALVQNIYELQKAVEIYKLDNGYYPGGPEGYGTDVQIYSQHFIGYDPDVGLDELTLMTPLFIPGYLAKFPSHIYPGGLYYSNMAFVEYILYQNDNIQIFCGSKPVKGYLIEYYDDSKRGDLSLPHEFVNGIESKDSYCLTGN